MKQKPKQRLDMKKLLILLLTVQLSAQSKAFTYNWQISSSTLIINFANNTQYPDYSSSRTTRGNIKITCKQEYLDFIDVLRSTEPAYYHFNSLQVYVGVVSNYFLIIDNLGRLWKLSKADALILANQLSLPIWVASVVNCAERQCICF